MGSPPVLHFSESLTVRLYGLPHLFAVAKGSLSTDFKLPQRGFPAPHPGYACNQPVIQATHSTTMSANYNHSLPAQKPISQGLPVTGRVNTRAEASTLIMSDSDTGRPTFPIRLFDSSPDITAGWRQYFLMCVFLCGFKKKYLLLFQVYLTWGSSGFDTRNSFIKKKNHTIWSLSFFSH